MAENWWIDIKQHSLPPIWGLSWLLPSYLRTVLATPSYLRTVLATPSYLRTVLTTPSYLRTVLATPSYLRTVLDVIVWQVDLLICKTITAYNHWRCEFKSCRFNEVYSTQIYEIAFVQWSMVGLLFSLVISLPSTRNWSVDCCYFSSQ